MSDIIDIAEFRARRKPKPAADEAKPADQPARLRVDGQRIVFDHPALDVLMYFTPELARRYASVLMRLAREVDSPRRSRP